MLVWSHTKNFDNLYLDVYITNIHMSCRRASTMWPKLSVSITQREVLK